MILQPYYGRQIYYDKNNMKSTSTKANKMTDK